MIENWGVNTFDDLHFLYLMDQGKIDGPSLTRRQTKDASYKTGWLAPFQFIQKHKPIHFHWSAKKIWLSQRNRSTVSEHIGDPT